MTIWIAFLVWIPISLYCFRRYPVRVAILINFIAGWGLLPSASFTPTNAPFPYWILGTSLWAGHFFTKASLIGMTCLVGLLLKDPAFLRRIDFNLWDLPMVVWCGVPLLSGLGNSQPLPDILGSEFYQVFAWGVPYLAGRLYFQDTDALILSAKAFVMAGVAYIPFCLVELFTGPQIYFHVYGFQPYRWMGAARYFSFRPVGFLEDGNQLGIWMATSALIAIWLWRRRLVDAIFGIPMLGVGIALFVVTLLCQSWGASVLLIGLLWFALLRGRFLRPVLAGFLLVLIAGAVTLMLANTTWLRSLVEPNHVASASSEIWKQIDRGGLEWRLSQDQRQVAAALQKPVLGSGQWDWWRDSSSRPWSLWLLTFGLYGFAGLLALECMQLLPVVRIFFLPVARGGIEGQEPRAMLAAVILMSAIDTLLNGTMILPLLLVIGGLSAPAAALAGNLTRRGRRRARPSFEPASQSRRRSADEVRQTSLVSSHPR